MSHAPLLARLMFNRPEIGNAIDLEKVRQLVTASIGCQTDTSIRCVALTSTGRLFCARGDVNLFTSARDHISAVLSELAGTLHMALARFARMPKSLLVLVNGPAVRAGLSPEIAGDIVLGGRSARFTAYGALGLTLGSGMSLDAARLAGATRALLPDSHAARFESYFESEARVISAAGDRGACREGLDAFFAKRDPQFRGV